MKSDRKKKIINVLRVCLCIGIVFIVCFFIYYLLKGNEIYISEESTDVKNRFIYCWSNDPIDPFFDYNGANTLHEIKYVIDEQSNVKSASYTYTNSFSSESLAKSVSSDLHFKYNDYMGHTSIYQEDLSPSFTVIGNTVIVNLFFSSNNIKSETSKILFLDLDGDRIPAAEDLMSMYEKKNISCSYKN